MTNELEIAKDVSVAILSASGLFLTLLVGFTFASAPRGVKPSVVLASFAFLLSAVLNVVALQQVFLSSQEANQKVDSGTRQLILVGSVVMCFGLGGLLIALFS